MATFKEYIVENDKKLISDLEVLMFKYKPKKFIKKVQNLKDKSWYWVNRENFNIWLDQNGYDSGAYTTGSLVDVFRNYRFNGQYMSTKMKDFISSELDFNTIKLPNLDRSYKIDDDLTFNIKYKGTKRDFNGIPTLLMTEWNGEPRLKGSSDFAKYFENLFELTVNGKSKKKDFVLALSSYRTRNKLSPADVISKSELLHDLYTVFKDVFKLVAGDTIHRELVTLAIVDEVIKDNYIQDNKEIVNTIKNELLACKSGDEAAEVLNRYNFSNIPDVKTLEGIIEDEYFTHTDIRPDSYGYNSGTTWAVNFQRRVIKSQGWNSGD